MKNVLSEQIFRAIDTRVAVLSLGYYALPVRFQVRGSALDCRVPAWVGSSDLLKTRSDVTIVAVEDTWPSLVWLFARGTATLVPDPDWEGFSNLPNDRVRLGDLYELVRVEPARLELFDERRGWGFRQTVDL